MSADQPGSAATDYDYGVAHVVSDGEAVRSAPSRTQAERDLHDCQRQASACYLVRRPVPTWERVPDGE